MQPPKDALDTMCLGAVDLDGLDVYTMLDHSPFDPTIKRTESVSGAGRKGGKNRKEEMQPEAAGAPLGALVVWRWLSAGQPRQGSRGRPANAPTRPHAAPRLPVPAQQIQAPDGTVFKVTKGAPQVIAKLCGADDQPEMKMRVEAEVANLGSRGIRSLAVARTYDEAQEKFELLGMLTFLDPPRPDTKHTVEQVGRAVGWAGLGCAPGMAWHGMALGCGCAALLLPRCGIGCVARRSAQARPPPCTPPRALACL